MKNNLKPELVAPAGDWSSLSSAVSSGADAVYFGIKGINMRHGASNFDVLELKKVMALLHKMGRKGYLALNVLVYNNEISKIRGILEEASRSGVDAVILWDMAVLSPARELGLKTHLSTQASVSNLEALKFYSDLGVERIVLARECSLDDIRQIISGIEREGISCGVETFIHGAMCLSISGRCLLSYDSFSKSANRGECIQPCRREFMVTDSQEECRYILGEDYVLSPKDLCTISFIDKLILSGVNAFKIEGRMRSPEYAKITTSVYREAIDAFSEGKLDEKLKGELLNTLKKSFNRGFSDGFYFKKAKDLGGKLQNNYEKVYLGEVVKFYKRIRVAEIAITNESLKKGQKILVTGKNTPAAFSMVEEMQIDHREVDFVPRGKAVGIKLPFKVRPKDKVFLWHEKA